MNCTPIHYLSLPPFAVEHGIIPEAVETCVVSPGVGGGLLTQAEESKYVWVLFMSEGRMEHEIDQQTGAAAAVTHLS